MPLFPVSPSNAIYRGPGSSYALMGKAWDLMQSSFTFKRKLLPGQEMPLTLYNQKKILADLVAVEQPVHCKVI